MFRKLDDFFRSYKTLTAGTGRILGALTDDSLAVSAAEGHRGLGAMAWHIVATVPEMMSRTGLPLSAVDPAAMPPANAAEIVGAYRRVCDELVAALKADWDDQTLETVDNLYGEDWPRGMTLQILIHHEIHHRGQITALMRKAGLVVPGIYGPAKEEWAAHGCDEPPY